MFNLTPEPTVPLLGMKLIFKRMHAHAHAHSHIHPEMHPHRSLALWGKHTTMTARKPVRRFVSPFTDPSHTDNSQRRKEGMKCYIFPTLSMTSLSQVGNGRKNILKGKDN